MSSSKAKLGGIYRVLLSDTHFYVGRSVDIVRRVREHRGRLARGGHPNIYLQRVYNQHRLFRWEVLLPCVGVAAVSAEQALLDSFIGTTGCLNLSPTAQAGPGMHTNETKLLMSDAQKGRVFTESHRQALSKARRDWSYSEEARDSMSKARKGRVFTEAHKQALSKAQRARFVSDDARKALVLGHQARRERLALAVRGDGTR